MGVLGGGQAAGLVYWCGYGVWSALKGGGTGAKLWVVLVGEVLWLARRGTMYG